MARSDVFDLFRLDQDEEENLLSPESQDSKSSTSKQSSFPKGSFSHEQNNNANTIATEEQQDKILSREANASKVKELNSSTNIGSPSQNNRTAKQDNRATLASTVKDSKLLSDKQENFITTKDLATDLETSEDEILLNIPSGLADNLDKDLEDILNFTDLKNQTPVVIEDTVTESVAEETFDPLEEVLFYTPQVNLSQEELAALEAETTESEEVIFNDPEDNLEQEILDYHTLTEMSKEEAKESKELSPLTPSESLSSSLTPEDKLNFPSQHTEKIDSQGSFESKNSKLPTTEDLDTSPKENTATVILPPLADFISKNPSISPFAKKVTQESKTELAKDFHQEATMIGEDQEVKTSTDNYKLAASSENPKKFPFLPPKTKVQPFKVAEKKFNLGKDEVVNHRTTREEGDNQDYRLGSTVSKKSATTARLSNSANINKLEQTLFRTQELDHLTPVNASLPPITSIVDDQNLPTTKASLTLSSELASQTLESFTQPKTETNFTINHQQLASSSSTSQAPLFSSTLGGAANLAQGLASFAQNPSSLDMDEEMISTQDLDPLTLEAKTEKIEVDLTPEVEHLNLDTSFTREYIKEEEDEEIEGDFTNNYYKDLDSNLSSTKIDPASNHHLNHGSSVEKSIEKAEILETTNDFTNSSLLQEASPLNISSEEISEEVFTEEDNEEEQESNYFDAEFSHRTFSSSLEDSPLPLNSLSSELYAEDFSDQELSVIPELKNTATVKLTSFKYEVSHSGKEVVDAQPSLLSPLVPALEDKDSNDSLSSETDSPKLNLEFSDQEEELIDSLATVEEAQEEVLDLADSELSALKLSEAEIASLATDELTKNLITNLSHIDHYNEEESSLQEQQEEALTIDLTDGDDNNEDLEQEKASENTDYSAQEALLAALAKAKTDLSTKEDKEPLNKTSLVSPLSSPSFTKEKVSSQKEKETSRFSTKQKQELSKQSKAIQNSLIATIAEHNQEENSKVLTKTKTSIIEQELSLKEVRATANPSRSLGLSPLTRDSTNLKPTPPSHLQDSKESLMDFSIFDVHQDLPESSSSSKGLKHSQELSSPSLNKQELATSLTTTQTKPNKKAKITKKNRFSFFNKKEADDFDPTDIFVIK